MGPSLIFDKSFLESLNPDEAMWLDQFFLVNITPLFFVETLADLDKHTKSGRTPEDIVGNLAQKTPDLHAKANVHHQSLLEGELSGQGKIDMKYGRPHIGGGKYVNLKGKTGVYFKESPEEESMHRWQDHKFLEVERMYAKKWRDGLSNLDLEYIYSQYKLSFAGKSKPKTMQEVKIMVDTIINNPDQEIVLKTGLASLGVSPKFIEEILNRWQSEEKPIIREFAPYFTHVLSVDLLFMLGIGADLIGRGRPSHKIDVAYLYYLPFCKIFVSNDKLHKLLAPIFLRTDQTFIFGEELKNDFKKLDEYYSKLPSEDLEKGVYFFASSPPKDTCFLTTQLWDKYQSPKWRERKGQAPTKDSPSQKNLLKDLKDFRERAEKEGVLYPSHSDQSDQILIMRNVKVKKGKWVRFSKEVTDRRKNSNGDWEDISDKN